ncbi:hypothetical protein ACIRPQ_20570 [Streptomyces sp. NPDC101213]|uniref:hypothetical protein n=1 Tax=Streptomyces sp. NPDC101213 TaxID=3366130 RepID=UPI0037F5D5B4
MSFGEPNNPYGPPPQQPPAAPGYGHPQQPPAPGHGVPQAPPYQQPYQQQPYPQQAYPQYPGGDPYFQGGQHPGGPGRMPRPTRVAQVLMGVIALAHLIVAGSYVWVLSRWDEEMLKAGVTDDPDVERYADLGKGIVVFMAGLATVFAVLGVVLLLQYAKGGNAVRVCSIVYGSFAIVTGIFMLTAWGLGLILIAVSILVIVFCAKRESAGWFRRPRY